MVDFEELAQAMGDLDEDTVVGSLNEVMADGGRDAQKAMEACQKGMDIVGNQFSAGEYFVGDLIYAGELMTEAVGILKDALVQGDGGSDKTPMILCTVKNDLHDIGKNIVKAMLEAGGFDVIDLGINVPADKIVETAKENEILPALRKTLDAMQGQDDSPYMADIFMPMLAHAQLSTKQWEMFYWPHLKQYLDMIVAAGKTAVIYLENSILRFANYFKDYPKGSIIMIIEMDDIFELRKVLPNVCLAGGMPSTLRGTGTPEQFFDRVKELIDGLGDGFILSQDKMMSFRNDCRRENLEVVCEYVNHFRW